MTEQELDRLLTYDRTITAANCAMDPIRARMPDGPLAVRVKWLVEDCLRNQGLRTVLESEQRQIYAIAEAAAELAEEAEGMFAMPVDNWQARVKTVRRRLAQFVAAAVRPMRERLADAEEEAASAAVSHVKTEVIVPDHMGALCQRCGEKLLVKLPIEVGLWCNLAKLFIDAHAGCKVPQPDPAQVAASMADIEAGKTRPIPEILAERQAKEKPVIAFDPLDVPCRYCGASIGQPCTFPEPDPSATSPDFHVTRVDEARERAVALHESA